MAEPEVTVDAVLRTPKSAEVTEGLERNPGSKRLVDQGWAPWWFELIVHLDGADGEHVHSLVWALPDRAPRDVGEEELELALEEALRNLRDLEGIEVWPEDVTRRTLRVEDGADPGGRP
jgi:hypothetical protein